MHADPSPLPASPSRFLRFAMAAGVGLVVLSAVYLLAPRLLGGATPEERQRIEAEWVSVVEAGAPGVGGTWPAWEGSALAQAVESAEAEGADAFFQAVGDGASCPLPVGSPGVVGVMATVSPERVAERSLGELEGLLTLARRWERQAPSLVGLLAAVAVGGRALDAALEREGGESVVLRLEPPEPADLFRAFCREQLALHAELEASVAAEVSGETLELTVLGLKVAGLHEADRMRGLLAFGAGDQGPAVEAPGRLAVWRALWLQRPEDLSSGIFLPLMSRELGSAAAAWSDHLARWEAVARDR